MRALYFCVLLIIASICFAAPVTNGTKPALVPAKIITEDSILRVPFSLSNPADKQIYDYLIANPNFRIYRENQARIRYQMALEEYDKLYAKHIKSLYSLADAFNYKFNPYQISYKQLLKALRRKSKSQQKFFTKIGAFTFVEVNQQLAELESNTHLFADRHTVYESALIEDALVHGVAGILDSVVDKVKSMLKRSKCEWCQVGASHIRNGACGAAGGAICDVLVSAVSGGIPGVSQTASKYLCDMPFYLAEVFTGWCNSAVKLFQREKLSSNKCYCALKVPDIKIPAVDIPAISYKSKPFTISIGGICAPDSTCPKWIHDNYKR